MVYSTYKNVLDTIGQTLANTGPNANEVTLIVVSKTFAATDILPVLEAGARQFGENRVQEAMAKWPQLRKQYSSVELHLIGPLQSNKVGDAVGLFDVIHTVDREKIASAIGREMKKQAKKLQLFVQVNTGGESQKAGVLPEQAVEFVKKCREEYDLEISGLMCIPPFDENPASHFAQLGKLAQQCDCRNLSMGMSGDYEIAIQFGATHVRVGSAIFGARS